MDFSLEGERIGLRPTCETDAGGLYPWVHQRPDVLRWVCWSGPESLASYAESLAVPPAEQLQGGELRLTIVGLDLREPLGTVSLRPRPGPAFDLGVWLAEPARGAGRGREAVALAARLAFERMGATGVTATVFCGNEPARALVESLGFQLVTTVRGMHRTRGACATTEPVDEWQFALTARGWKRNLVKNESDGTSNP